MTAVEEKPQGGRGEPVGSAGIDETAESRSIADRVPPGLVLRWAAAATLGVLLVLLSGYALYTVRGILVLVLIALFVAVSLDPAVRWLVRKGLARPAAVTLVILLMLGLFGVFIWSIVPPLIEQGGKLVGNLPGYLRKLPEQSRTFQELSDRYNLTNRLSALAADLPTRVASSAVGFVQQFFGAVLSTVTVLVLTIYFMADMPRMRRGLVRLFPHRRRPQVAEIVNVVVDKVGAYMIGNLIISLFAGVSSFLCLALLKVPFALPLAIAVAIADLIPLVGATLGAALCVLVTFFTVDLWPAGVVVLVFFIVYQQVENYLIAPRVLRNSVDLSSVAVLLVALIGGSVLGVVGALMSIPIAAAVKVVITPTIASMHEPPPPAEARSRAPAAS
ncbi:AI-2E family transporter [Planosporangium flavigriseum]|uniref:AI-2E family transporter n=1 Tax=Planosporangium flavigriseum TaxID=373681 RepID=UPI00143B2C2E|nr:AI-2E family transporter [Planosporangium flavigriseum]NJC67141.1 AI-2E family transporter [Planosporangium flavigriseum]